MVTKIAIQADEKQYRGPWMIADGISCDLVNLLKYKYCNICINISIITINNYSAPSSRTNSELPLNLRIFTYGL